MTLNEFKNLSNEELIKLFKDFGYSAKSVNDAFGFSRNTTERLFNKRGIDRGSLVRDYKRQLKEDYERNPKVCKHCGKPISWEKRLTNEYCSSSCAASENNKGKVKNPNGNNGRRAKTKEEYLEHRRLSAHNRIIETNYSQYNIPKVLPGCCPICGEYQCDKEFCKKHNFSQLIGLAKRYGLDAGSIGTTKIFEEFERIKKIIYDLYWNQGFSGQDLADKFNVPYTAIIYHDFEIFNIPRRSFEESSRNTLIQGKNFIPDTNQISGLSKSIHQEWHTTWTGESVFLRSSYEIDYANWLDKNQISYSVEELRIEYYDSQQDKTRVAIPDFYLTSTNEIVEIKSDYTLDIQEMLDKFESYKNKGYIPKLVLEGKEVDIYKIEEEVDEKRLEKIKNKNISAFKRNNNEN